MSKNFDGVNDSIDPGVFTVTLPYTIAMWIYPESWGASSLGSMMFAGAGATAFRLNNSGANLNRIQHIVERVGGISDNTAISNDGRIGLNLWQCVAGSYATGDGGPRIYYAAQATPFAEISYASRGAGVGGSADENIIDPDIGVGSGGANQFDGNIGYFTLWNQVLSVAQLEQFRLPSFAALNRISTSGGTVVTLEGHWPLNESAAGTALDYSPNARNGTVSGAVLGPDPPRILQYGPRVGVLPAAAAAVSSDWDTWKQGEPWRRRGRVSVLGTTVELEDPNVVGQASDAMLVNRSDTYTEESL